ncbi:MAG: cytochrome-c oxidase, cbb3-type subunit I [Saprospiraceae bacterium]|nr:cytochrome-c oxidase, cbb3-type subunit I [Saprospiraceae bacterium]HMW38559.1 cytochrome-c oxidase, cbb3-type subunit I [Saprospiraceae bacterium]HMX88760.1 cytochrome-c oxidase, cbb3-type subunit I [Saprospiraceae bacterium]HMZ40460.1 cytochrome-c oxidase, cbb3-type subunit I [Saprospiraceae bacterium]HNA64329.1 cytochrome-c oxidase, cbb3-type subunit I [Saprospiraceae bacterium]
MNQEKFTIDNKIPRLFAIACVFWGAVGMLLGVIAAFQLAFPALNFSDYFPNLAFGRLRPVHTNAVIFAFVGNGIFTAVYYSLPRLLKTSMWSNLLSRIHFWGWQLIIVLAAVTLLAGYTTGKEYAELEWPIDILITLIWVVFGINMFGTILTRRERHMYVAIWFFIASWVTVAMLHIVNSLEMPVSLFKSYSWYAGVQDALVQWWYGHNAVAFFLTTPYLGLMYYFLPKAAERPVYSYRLSIVHFWSLIFLYIWAGPHHLLYTALPDWAQSLGTAFSIMLILPSWGGMLNGLFTLRGAWDKVREDPVLKFFVVAVTCYGMATFEGPMLSLKNVNAISHYSDWTVAHVHIGALGWNGFMTFGMMYWLIPKLFNTQLYSRKLASMHFWIGTLGIILYAIPMYWSAFRAYFMMKTFTPEGQLQYQFIDVVQSVVPFYIMRAVGGTIFLVGVFVMVYNLIKTARQGRFVAEEYGEAAPLSAQHKPVSHAFTHAILERKPLLLLVLSLIVVAIGGIFELIPTFLVKENIPTISSVKPYTPLELQGRDIYIREGCYNCHSQMIRPFRYEVKRYGDYSKAGEFVYDHPFQWGSKRTGPDLAREGGKYSDSWHFNHMLDPRSMAPGSIMPSYPFLFEKDIDRSTTMSKIHAMRNLGVPYPANYEVQANDDMDKQAQTIATSLKESKIDIPKEREIIALIAYLQRLGKDVKLNK